MGHSAASLSDGPAVCFRLRMADRAPEATRVVPACIDQDGRTSYLAIAKRAQTEAVHMYTVLVLGAEMYRMSQKLKLA